MLLCYILAIAACTVSASLRPLTGFCCLCLVLLPAAARMALVHCTHSGVLAVAVAVLLLTMFLLPVLLVLLPAAAPMALAARASTARSSR